ncbi:hypothetical protein ACWGI8_35670 [Streptomyces sp. NPDC054841]
MSQLVQLEMPDGQVIWATAGEDDGPSGLGPEGHAGGGGWRPHACARPAGLNAVAHAAALEHTVDALMDRVCADLKRLAVIPSKRAAGGCDGPSRRHPVRGGVR